MGLCAALRLAQAGRRVTLFEAAPEPGGVSASFRLGPHTVDRFYHTVLSADTALLGLIDELGLLDQVAWRPVRTGFFKAGRLHSVTTPLELLRFPVLSFPERIRLGLMAVKAQRLADWQSIRGLTCAEWLTRECGAGVYDKMWRPLLKGKLGDAAPRVSASFIWATLNRLQSDRKDAPLKRDDRMGFIRGGYATVLTRLVERLRELGVELRTGAPIRALARDGEGWRVETAAGAESFPDVVATLPHPVLHALLGGEAGPPGGAADPGADVPGIRALDYLGVVVEVLLLKRPLSPYYILNLGDDDLTMTGVIETTNLAPAGYFGGQGLVYIPRYVSPGDPFWERSDDAVRAAFHADLARIFPGFNEEWIVESRVQRARHVQPVHTTDYLENLPPVHPAPGLWVAGSSQVYPWPLNNDRILRTAEAATGALLGNARPQSVSGSVSSQEKSADDPRPRVV